MYCAHAVNNVSVGKTWKLSTIMEKVLIIRSLLLEIKKKIVKRKTFFSMKKIKSASSYHHNKFYRRILIGQTSNLARGLRK